MTSLRPPARPRRTATALLVVGALAATVGACARGADEPDLPETLPDACALLSPEVLARLAPAQAEPVSTGAGAPSGQASCDVDLTLDGGSGMRGDLGVALEIDRAGAFGADVRQERCAEAGAEVTTEGPGDHACVAVTQFDGTQSRVDGWAWVGDGGQVRVVYQLVEPRTLPPTAEADVRDLLADAVDALTA